MLPSFLITFREVIEVSLIVATILGILTKLGQKKEVKTVWMATAAAAITSVLLLGLASSMGLKAQELYSGRTEQLIEGVLLSVSAVFITWAVFFLHNYFGKYKTTLLAQLRETVQLEINGVHQSLYGIYTVFIAWWVFGRRAYQAPKQVFGSDH